MDFNLISFTFCFSPEDDQLVYFSIFSSNASMKISTLSWMGIFFNFVLDAFSMHFSIVLPSVHRLQLHAKSRWMLKWYFISVKLLETLWCVATKIYYMYFPGCMGIETKKHQDNVNRTFYWWHIRGCCSTAYLPLVLGTSCR